MPDKFQFSLFSKFPQIEHGFIGRASGLTELAKHNFVISQQVHGVKIYNIEKTFLGRLEIDGYDGLATRQKEITLVLKTADCAPLLFFDPVTQTIAAAHAGRAGTELGIAAKMVEHLAAVYSVNPADLLVGLGPAICVNCYQIDRARDLHYDLAAENQKQLTAAGVQNLELSGLCTACSAQERFYSYRREKTDRRNFAFIRLKQV
ncbi:protein YfiH-like superfamily [Candidatus Termititenax aidoneus]|uniref:Protein YfiH-like superfamily n=1 Tax=Termititenax aidoneus TaxID=2218524 RepID=A0A388TB65_TERA1|nr:protein YfiH-like superfamily [Candidatus Termititenax aidoneus]